MECYKFKNKYLTYATWIIVLIAVIFFCSRLIAGEIILDLPSSNVATENDVRDHAGYVGLYNKDAAIVFDLPLSIDSTYNYEIQVIAKQDSMPGASALLTIEFLNDTTQIKVNSTVFKTFNAVIENVNSHQVKFRFANAAYTDPGGAYQDRNLYIDKITMIYSLVPPEPSDSTRQITVQWDPNSEPDLAGYKLYYGFNSRDYLYRIDVKSENISLFTDKYRTYYFAVTAYDTANNESSYSVEVALEADIEPINEYYDGDVNYDLVVNESDFFIILFYMWQTNIKYDMNGDKLINEYEFFHLLADMWKTGYKVQ